MVRVEIYEIVKQMLVVVILGLFVVSSKWRDFFDGAEEVIQ